MVKYATALRLGTAEAEQILRRFTRPGPQHPTYAALDRARPGGSRPSFSAATCARKRCAARSTKGCRWWRTGTAPTASSSTARTANSPAPIATDQEVTMLALHLLQSALVYVNTLLLQRVLADQPINLTAEDRRALSPLFWTHVRPYGTFALHLDRHLDLDPHPVSA